MVSGNSCSPISSHIWNITFSSGYHILRETLINWGVSERGGQDGVYLETGTDALQLLKLAVPGKRLEGNKRSGSEAMKVCPAEEGFGLF